MLESSFDNTTGMIVPPDLFNSRSQLTDWYSNRGSPTFSISGMVHFRSNALERTILKIFWTLILWLVLLKMRLARIAFAKRRAWEISQLEDLDSRHARGYLIADLFLIFSWEIDKVVIFGADEERDGSLIKSSTLSVPLFDTVEGGFPSQVEHEEDGDGIVADERQHVDEFPLTTEIPNRKSDLCVSYRDGLFHKVDTCRG